MKANRALAKGIILMAALAFLVGCTMKVDPWCPDSGCLGKERPCSSANQCIPESVLFAAPDGGTR